MKKKKTNKNYFTQDTEDAIVEYNSTTNQGIKNRIYNDRIHYAFFKLTENIIHTFKFYYTDVDDIVDLQNEVISFLISKIHLFDPTKGAKAFSYFGTIAKRYLILYNDKNYKNDLLRIGLPDKFIDHGTQAELHKILKMDVEGIVERTIQFLSKEKINDEVNT